MACATCLRRNKPCDRRRPRCGPCRASHLRCAYPRPPGVYTFLHEGGGGGGGGRRGRRGAPSPSRPPEPPLVVATPAANASPATPVSEGRPRPGGPGAQDGLAGMLPSPWHDDFYYEFTTERFPDLDFDFDAGLAFLRAEPAVGSPPAPAALPAPLAAPLAAPLPAPLAVSPSHRDAAALSTATSPATPPPATASRAANPPGPPSLPGHILAQHYSSELARKYSSKSAEWTFYTYFFHRFTQSHPWVLRAIQAWTATHLFYAGKTASLDGARRDYAHVVAHMEAAYGISHGAFGGAQTPPANRRLAEAPPDDVDAVFVGHFFLALADLMAARPLPFRRILRFVAYLLHTPAIESRMTGIRSRVASWFCILDGKASAFQASDGAVLAAIGGESGVVAALHESYLTLQQAYSLTYPDEQRRGDAEQLPLLQRMLCLSALLHEITQLKHAQHADAGDRQGLAGVAGLRRRLDAHRDAVQQLAAPAPAHASASRRARSTFLVLSALYNAVEIAFSRGLCPGLPRHAAARFARTVIRLAQELATLQAAAGSGGTASVPSTTPPPTKYWPLPLVMAAVEVDDLIYREWAIDRLAAYARVGGDHYVYATEFVQLVCATEDRAMARVDWEPLMAVVRDGLVI